MATEGLYPFATPRGEAVPLEIVKPKSLVKYGFAAGTPETIAVPAGYKTCWIYATQDCILRFDATVLPAGLVDGTAYTNSIFVPANTPLVVEVTAGAAQLLGLAEPGDIYINSITQWAALNQQIQTSVG